MTVDQTKPARRFNRLGLAGLVLSFTAYLVMLVFTVFASVSIFRDIGSTEVPYVLLGLMLFLAYGAGAGAPFGLLGMILGIASLFLKNRGKAMGIVALALGLPIAVVGSSFIGTAYNGLVNGF